MATKEMTETKPWYLSTGIIGSASAVVAGVLGIWFAGIDKASVEAILTGSGAVVGGVVALIGRIKADKKIG